MCNQHQEQKEAFNPDRKLMEFYVMQGHIAKSKHGQFIRTKHQFCIYGTYDWKKTENSDDTDDATYLYPAFSNLRVTRISEGKEIPYDYQDVLQPKALKAEHMITKAIAMEIRGTTAETYQTLFLDKGLREFVNCFRSDENYVLTVSGLPIYKYIVSDDLRDRFELNMVTDVFIYYAYCGMFDVLGTSDHHLISNNEFADNCYLESIENIKNGVEKLIWGTIPKKGTEEDKEDEWYQETYDNDEPDLEFR